MEIFHRPDLPPLDQTQGHAQLTAVDQTALPAPRPRAAGRAGPQARAARQGRPQQAIVRVAVLVLGGRGARGEEAPGAARGRDGAHGPGQTAVAGLGVLVPVPGLGLVAVEVAGVDEQTAGPVVMVMVPVSVPLLSVVLVLVLVVTLSIMSVAARGSGVVPVVAAAAVAGDGGGIDRAGELVPRGCGAAGWRGDGRIHGGAGCDVCVRLRLFMTLQSIWTE